MYDGPLGRLTSSLMMLYWASQWSLIALYRVSLVSNTTPARNEYVVWINTTKHATCTQILISTLIKRPCTYLASGDRTYNKRESIFKRLEISSAISVTIEMRSISNVLSIPVTPRSNHLSANKRPTVNQQTSGRLPAASWWAAACQLTKQPGDLLDRHI